MREFVAHKYDLKFLVRAITRSRPYQLASRRTHASQQEPRHFSRMLIKGLTSDQLFDSLVWATGNAESQVNRRGNFSPNGQRERFRELFGQQVASPGEVQTSILQALLMLNGDFVDQASSPQQSMTLSAIIDAPFFNNEERLETLFLAALARPPRPDEAAVFLKYFEGQGPDHDSKQALGDVYWALLNSSEFFESLMAANSRTGRPNPLHAMRTESWHTHLGKPRPVTFRVAIAWREWPRS